VAPTADTQSIIAAEAVTNGTDPVVATSLSALLTEDTLDAVLEEAEKDGVSLTDLAAKYGVDESTLGALLSEKFTPEKLAAHGLQVIGKRVRSTRKS